MSEKFKAVVIDNQDEKFSRDIKELDTNTLKDGYTEELEQNTGAAEPKKRSKGTVYTNVA